MAIATALSAARERLFHYFSPPEPAVRLSDTVASSPNPTSAASPGHPTRASERTVLLASWIAQLFRWARASESAMQPATMRELVRNGFSFISDRILSHATLDDADSADNTDNTDITDQSSTSPSLSFSATSDPPLTVERLKRPSPSTAAALPTPVYHPDYEFIWRDDPSEYITPDGFEAVTSLLHAWGDDVAARNISRCHDTGRIVRRFDGTSGGRTETRLSLVIHNLMLDRHGCNTEQAWQDTVAGLVKALRAVESWMAAFYSTENLTSMRYEGNVPYEQLSASVQRYWPDSCGLCEVASFLAFAILQTDQWGHPGMHLTQLSLMKLLVDLDAFHRQQPILSFIRVEKEVRAPGSWYEDSDGMIENVTAHQLYDCWRYRRKDELAALGTTPSSRDRRQPCYWLQHPCRLYAEGALTLSAEETARQARILSAAAASLKTARWSAGSSRPLHISPSPSLLYSRYRRRSSEGLGLPAHGHMPAPAVKTYSIIAKRKAPPAPSDPRRFKRGRVGRDLISEIERARAEEAAAAASIPLPPSPAATEISSDDSSTELPSAADATNTKKTLPGKQLQKRLPQWEAIFAEDDVEDGRLPRLRISTAKAEELRLIAERKRAEEEAERRRREEERRRKEEEELRARTRLRPPTRQAIPPLSDAWLSRVVAAARANSSQEVAKSPEGTSLRSSDLRTVVSKSEWLNDEIVNGFLLHLANYINHKAGITNVKTQTPRCHTFTSFFWKSLSTKGAAGTERWMKRVGVTRDNFLAIETILIPICERNHWTLVVVRPKQGSVTHMDSMGSGGCGRKTVTEMVMRWVREHLRDKYVSEHWRVQHYTSPRQTNGWDCGVHTITNALFIALGLDPSFYSAREMPLQRDRIAATLINGGFSGDLDLAGL